MLQRSTRSGTGLARGNLFAGCDLFEDIHEWHWGMIGGGDELKGGDIFGELKPDLSAQCRPKKSKLVRNSPRLFTS